jgi:hypothetical protein
MSQTKGVDAHVVLVAFIPLLIIHPFLLALYLEALGELLLGGYRKRRKKKG